ncbi:hypothetical protein HK096_001516, partial [Nowakowskiella sp. JEL0078]
MSTDTPSVFDDIMARKKQIETLTSSPSRPTSAQPAVKQINVQSSWKEKEPEISIEKIEDEPIESVKRPNYDELSKPYDPTINSSKSPNVKNLKPSETQIPHKTENINHLQEKNLNPERRPQKIPNLPIFSDIPKDEKDKSESEFSPKNSNKGDSEILIEYDKEDDDQNAISPANEASTSEYDLTKSQKPENTSGLITGPCGVMVAARPSVVIRPKFFKRLPTDGILRCKVYRKKAILRKANPIFVMKSEADDAFILAARKIMNSKNVNFVISTSEGDLSKDYVHY